MATEPQAKKPTAEEKRKRDARTKIDNELGKIEAVVNRSIAFSEIKSEADFLKLAKEMMEGYGHKFNRSDFKTIKKVDNGTNTKSK